MMRGGEEARRRGGEEVAYSPLLRLDPGLWGAVWPSERYVLGMRVCKQLRERFQAHQVDLIYSGEFVDEKLKEDMCRLQQPAHVRLQWSGGSCELWVRNGCAISLRKFACKLLFSSTYIRTQMTVVLLACAGFETLVHLDLSSEKVRAQLNLGGLLLRCKSLARLDLANNGGAGRVLGGGTSFPQPGVWSALSHLDLQNNEIDEDEARALGFGLRNCEALAHLNLSNNKIGSLGACWLAGADWQDTEPGDSDNTADIAPPSGFSHGLRTCKALAHLDLSNNQIESVGARKLCVLLRECRALALLNLSNNLVDDEGVRSLAEELRGSKALAHLDLSSNQIGEEGASALAGVLGVCEAISHLNLSNNNQIGPGGAGRLAGVLWVCGTLKHLDLSWCGIGKDGARRLARAGELVKCSVNVDNNGTLAQFVPVLSDARRAVSLLLGRGYRDSDSASAPRVPRLLTSGVALPVCVALVAVIVGSGCLGSGAPV